MELAVRSGSDRFVPSGAYRALEAGLRKHLSRLEEIPAVVLSAFDRNTRLLPFLFYDSHMFPLGASLIAGALYQAGFSRTRGVFQL
ncbi:MAG: radical SAM protein, partial [bacterium]